MRRFRAAATLLFALVIATAAIPLAQQQPPASPQPPKQDGQQPPKQDGQQPPKQEGSTPKQEGSTPPRQGAGGGNTTPAKPLVPLAASTITANPEPYLGQYISLTAAVEQPLTKSTFSVEQNKAKADKDILIIAPTMTGSVEPNTYVTVLGELVKFDPDEVRKKTKNYSLDLSPELVARYKDKPAVVATAVVVNSTGIDIAKVLPPPMTAEEEAFQKVMRQVGPANTALRGAIDKMDSASVKDQAAILAKAFTQTEAFWKTRGKADAVGFAVEAKKHADAITAAANAGKWDDVKAEATPLGQQCASCHGAHRERLDDGSFRIKAGSR